MATGTQLSVPKLGWACLYIQTADRHALRSGMFPYNKIIWFDLIIAYIKNPMY